MSRVDEIIQPLQAKYTSRLCRLLWRIQTHWPLPAPEMTRSGWWFCWRTWWNMSKWMCSVKTPQTFSVRDISSAVRSCRWALFTVAACRHVLIKATLCCGSELHYALLTHSRQNWWRYLLFGFETPRGERTLWLAACYWFRL